MNKKLFLIILLIFSVPVMSEACLFLDNFLCEENPPLEDLTYTQWLSVDQSKLAAEEIKLIPVDIYDPFEIREQYLTYSTFEQVQRRFLEFDNLALLNSSLVSQVFKEDFYLDLEFPQGLNLYFNLTHLSGDFATYDPFMFIEFKQVLDENALSLIDGEVVISSFNHTNITLDEEAIYVYFERDFVEVFEVQELQISSMKEFYCIGCSLATNFEEELWINVYLGDFNVSQDKIVLFETQDNSLFYSDLLEFSVVTTEKDLVISSNSEISSDVFFDFEIISLNGPLAFQSQELYLNIDEDSQINISSEGIEGKGRFLMEDDAIFYENKQGVFKKKTDPLVNYVLASEKSIFVKAYFFNESEPSLISEKIALNVTNKENLFELEELKKLRKTHLKEDASLLPITPITITLKEDSKELYIDHDWTITLNDSVSLILLSSPLIENPSYELLKEMFIDQLRLGNLSLIEQQELLQEIFLIRYEQEGSGLQAYFDIKELIDLQYLDVYENNAISQWVYLYFLELFYEPTLCSQRNICINTEVIFDNNIVRDYLREKDMVLLTQRILTQSRFTHFTSKELIELELTNVILNLEFQRSRMVSPETNSQLYQVQVELLKIWQDYALSAYRGLIHLEDIHENSAGDLTIENSKFSSKKLELIKGALALHLEKEQYGAAFSLIDTLESFYFNSILTNAYNVDFEENVDVFKKLFDEIRLQRIGVSNLAFKKINLNLLETQDELEVLFTQRSGYVQRVQNKEVFDNTFASVVLSGGFGKNLLWAAGVYDDFSSVVNNLNRETQEYAKGLFVLESMVTTGVSGEDIKNWLDERLSSRDIILKYLTQESDGLSFMQPEEVLLGKGLGAEEYIYSSEEIRQIHDLLDELKPFARQVYYNSPYADDLPTIIGYEKRVDLDYEGELLSIDLGEDLDFYKQKVSEFRFNSAQRVLNYIDEGLSPVTIALIVGTGGKGLTLTGATGTRGIAQSGAEFMFVDSVTGVILVAADMEDSMAAQMITSVTSSVGLVAAHRAIRNAPRAMTNRFTHRTLDSSNLYLYVRTTIRPGVIDSFRHGARAQPDSFLRVISGEGDQIYLRVVGYNEHGEVILQRSDGLRLMFDEKVLRTHQPDFNDVRTLNDVKELYVFAELRGLRQESQLLHSHLFSHEPLPSFNRFTGTHGFRDRLIDVYGQENYFVPAARHVQEENLRELVQQNTYNKFRFWAKRALGDVEVVRPRSSFAIGSKTKLVNYHSSAQENMVLDFSPNTATSNFYRELEGRLSRTSSFEEFALVLYNSLEQNIKYSKKVANSMDSHKINLPRIFSRDTESGPFIKISKYRNVGDVCLTTGGGVCRHYGFMASAFTQKFVEEVGSINIRTTYSSGPGHAWAELVHPNTGDVYVLDVAQGYLGPAVVSRQQGVYDSRVLIRQRGGETGSLTKMDAEGRVLHYAGIRDKQHSYARYEYDGNLLFFED